MPVNSASRRAGPYTGGSSFPFDFTVFEDADIQVVVTDADGVETTLALGVDYTVTRNADQKVDPGGEVSYASLAGGESLTIIGNVAYEQGVELPVGGNFNATIVQQALDRAVILIQQLREQLSRAILQPISTTLANLTIPDPEEGSFLRWASGKLVNSALVTSGVLALPLGIDQGGHGATTASGARTNLGLGGLATKSVVGNAELVASAITGQTELTTTDAGADYVLVWDADANSGAGGLVKVKLTNLVPASAHSLSVLTKTATYNATTSDKGKVILFTSTGTILNLPAASGNDGLWYSVINGGTSGDVTIDPNGSEQLDGQTTRVLRPGDRVIIACDGTDWWTISGRYTFESAEQTISLSTLYTLPHGLGVKPNHLRLVMRCKIAEKGWAVGQEVEMGTHELGTSYGGALVSDPTNIEFITQQTYLPNVRSKSSPAATWSGITAANWRFVVYAADDRG